MSSKCIFVLPDNSKSYAMNADVILASSFGKGKVFKNVNIKPRKNS